MLAFFTTLWYITQQNRLKIKEGTKNIMSILTSERQSNLPAASAGELFIRRPIELAKAVLPYAMNEAADAPFLDVENTLSSLTHEAEEMIEERGKATRKVRRALSQYAHRLLEITDEEPDLLDPYSINLIGHAADATGERDLLETTLEQAHRADLPFDTNVNLQAIEAALKQDVPFTEIMLALNKAPILFTSEDDSTHTPLPSDYEFLYDRSIMHNRAAPLLDENGRELSTARPLYRD